MSSPHIKRLLRFRLRSLLVLTALVAILLGWYAVTARQYAVEMAALERLKPYAHGALMIEREGEGLEWSGQVYIEAKVTWRGPKWTRQARHAVVCQFCIA